MKTDLQKILSISGESGLYLFLSQAKAGVIAESLSTKKRTSFGMSAKVTSLSDISIYTDAEELPLRELFLKMKEHLADAAAPDQKSDSKVLVKFFEEVLPTYDREKFYVSHMKKVVQWYNQIREFASFDFEDPDEATEDNGEKPVLPAAQKPKAKMDMAAKAKAPKVSKGSSTVQKSAVPQKKGNS